MEVLAALGCTGLSVAIQPGNLLFAGIGVLLGTLVGILPGHQPVADRRAAAAGDLQARPDRLDHHVRRHLLRRHVRQLDHGHPAQHAGRGGVDRDGDRRAQDGARGPRRARRSRPRPSARSSPARSPRSAWRCWRRPSSTRRRLRPLGLLRPDGAGLRHHLGDLRRLGAARPDQPGARPGARPGRHRQAHRPGAARLRRAVAARRRLDHDPGRGPVRDGRGAVRRLALHRRARDGSRRCAARCG